MVPKPSGGLRNCDLAAPAAPKTNGAAAPANGEKAPEEPTPPAAAKASGAVVAPPAD